jgi:hypothetical protein
MLYERKQMLTTAPHRRYRVGDLIHHFDRHWKSAAHSLAKTDALRGFDATLTRMRKTASRMRTSAVKGVAVASLKEHGAQAK